MNIKQISIRLLHYKIFLEIAFYSPIMPPVILIYNIHCLGKLQISISISAPELLLAGCGSFCFKCLRGLSLKWGGGPQVGLQSDTCTVCNVLQLR